jgi:predicted nucleic acid-binding protein
MIGFSSKIFLDLTKGRDMRVRRRIGELYEASRLVICIITVAELLYSVRDVDEVVGNHMRLAELRFLPITSAVENHKSSIDPMRQRLTIAVHGNRHGSWTNTAAKLHAR